MPTTSPGVQKLIDEMKARTERTLARTEQLAQEIAAINGGGTLYDGMPPNESERFLAQLGSGNGRLLRRIQEVARMPETFGMRQFHQLIEKEMGYGEAECIERFFALCDLYLQYRTRRPYAHMDEPLAPDHWSGVGPVSYNAPASKRSVVDAVFARLGA